MYRVPYTGVSMSVALVRLHVLIKIFIGPYLRVTLSIHDIDFRAGLVADPSIYACGPCPWSMVHVSKNSIKLPIRIHCESQEAPPRARASGPDPTPTITSP
jgi:hypothetical protein